MVTVRDPILRSLLTVVALASLASSCDNGLTDYRLTGVASNHAPLANLEITVCDATGSKKTTTTDAWGVYRLDATDLVAPLVIAVSESTTVSNGSVQYAALLPTLDSGTNVANVNPLTDKIASDVATTDMGLAGTVQLIAACRPAAATAATIAAKTANLRALIKGALEAHDVRDPDTFDPVTRPMIADHVGIGAVVGAVIHARAGFSDSVTTEWGATSLFDRNMQLISESNVALDPTLRPWWSYRTRIFIAGDSTASNYPRQVLPRMGWGQVFDRMLTAEAAADTKVINVAQSGRSSRSFIFEGWFRLIQDNLRPGDFLLVQFGHNDEKCGAKATVDLANRCTYPGKTEDTLAAGLSADMSFQHTIEKYVKMAEEKGATAILLTPLTRIVQDKSVTTHVEGRFPITATTHVAPGDSAVNPRGDYSQTLRDTALASGAPLVDIDQKSIAWANSLGVGVDAQGNPGGPEATGGWRDYYLAVKDFTAYPYYSARTTTGNYLNADRTHTQENGAVKVASLVVEGLKESGAAALAPLVGLLR